MNKKEITINNKQYHVAFDIQTMMNFEEITSGKSFFAAKFNTITEKVALIAAAVYSADKESDITIEDIVGNKDWEAVKQIMNAFSVVSEVMEPFFTIPEIEKQNNPEPPAEEQQENEEKN